MESTSSGPSFYDFKCGASVYLIVVAILCQFFGVAVTVADFVDKDYAQPAEDPSTQQKGDLEASDKTKAHLPVAQESGNDSKSSNESNVPVDADLAGLEIQVSEAAQTR